MEYPSVTLYGMAGVDAPSIEEGVTIGDGTRVGQNTYIGMNVRIGRNCRIMQHVTICKDAIIGDDVFIGPNTTLLNDKYPPTKVSYPPTLRCGSIIGGGSVIGPNHIIGFRSVVGHGSNVTKDIPDEEVWCGNPASFYMTREKYDIKQFQLLERRG